MPAKELAPDDQPVPWRLEIAGHPHTFATGDGDGRMDFALANDGSEAITVLLSRH